VALLVAAAHAKRNGASARNPNTGEKKEQRKKERKVNN
jgi:hypothetical protein